MPATTLVDRAILRLAGDDVRGFLQGLVTSDVTALTPPTPIWTGLLTPQGKALFDFILWQDGNDILIDCEAGRADALMRRLTVYRLRRAVTIVRDDALVVHWALTEAAANDGRDGGNSYDGRVTASDPRLAALGYRWLGSATDEATGWLAHRLSFGVTEGVAELGDGETLWLECNARELGGVSFAKGCYIGQENTARMHHRAKVNRRLIVAPLGEPSERTRVTYPELGLMVEHRRVEALGNTLVPAWLGLSSGGSET